MARRGQWRAFRLAEVFPYPRGRAARSGAILRDFNGIAQPRARVVICNYLFSQN